MSVNDACEMRPACGCNATSAIRTLECLPVKLSICAIASEVVPLAKSGGLADVASALSRQLTASGHDVRLFVPFYRQIARDKLNATKVDSLVGMPVAVGRHEYVVDVWRA